MNWKELTISKQQLEAKANLQENKNKVDYAYHIEEVYLTKDDILRKLDRI